MYSENKDFLDNEKLLKTMTDCCSGIAGAHSDKVFADLRLLEVGGGGGILAGLSSTICSKIICSDFVDQNKRYGGEFFKLF